MAGFPYPNLVQTPSVIAGSLSTTFEGPTINGIPMPGQWILTKSPKAFGWQQQQANFLTGAYLVPKGDPLMEFEYEINIWEDATYTIFLGLLATLFKKPIVSLAGVPASAALGIDDQILKAHGVTACVVSSIQTPLNPLVSSGGKGAWKGSMSFIEYRAPIPALPVPDQSIPDVGAVTPSAATNQATAQASVAAGDAARQAAAASALVPPR